MISLEYFKMRMEKLETKNNQIRTNSEMLGFAHEDMKAELFDVQEETGKINFQVKICWI